MANSRKEAVEALLIKREKVYREDPDRLLQDARGAQRAARDYRGRWLWELLQNCEPPAGQEKGAEPEALPSRMAACVDARVAPQRGPILRTGE
jgi:hypothetical protein